MNGAFPEIKGGFGFGIMRLPMKKGEADLDEVCRMADAFLDAGFNYFDTAHGYLSGKSESIFRRCVAERHPRDSYLITDKLSDDFFQKEEDIRPLFEKQLEECGVSYFDFYLMHAQNAEVYPKYRRCRAYETALQLKEEGKIRHFGISFHDTAAVLEQILTDYPQIEAVQIQLNYLDYEDSAVQSRKCLEVCERFGKPVFVMEPVKGGSLVRLPEEADALLRNLNGGSNASYALRFAAEKAPVAVVLSGMGNLQQMQDNLEIMKNFRALTPDEENCLKEVVKIIRSRNLIPCTACRYCVAGCPAGISIPDLFACMNAKMMFHNWNSDFYYHNVHTVHGGKASDCLKCGRCEHSCPQHLPIRQLLEKTAETFEKKK